jgi:hypothetical protein
MQVVAEIAGGEVWWLHVDDSDVLAGVGPGGDDACVSVSMPPVYNAESNSIHYPPGI